MKVTKTNKLIMSVLVILWIAAGISVINFAFAQSNQQPRSQSDSYSKLRLFTEVFNRVRTTYIYDIDVDEVIDAAIDGMLGELDVHTNLFRPDDFEEFQTGTRGRFGGLGISIDKQGDYITVVSPIGGTPAYNMGILAGDRIISVDDENIVGMSTDEAIRKMRGDPGTQVTITIERPGVEENLVFNIVREMIEIKSIPYSFRFDDGIGYIRIRQFNANTSNELSRAIDELEEKGLRGLMIDLRFNPGGLLNEAIDTVNEFVGKGKKVVFTKGRIPQANQEFYTTKDVMRTGYPVVVLINEASASASEIFAGSMQDWDKGLVVGKTSFGKGSVQQLFPLSGGYGVKVTTSKYYIHSGRCIDREYYERILRGEEISEEEMKKIEAERKKKIYHTNMGRVVYGGGGITPDIEIEQATLNPFQIDLRRKNLFFPFSIDYLVEHEDEITKDFQVTEQMFNDFIDYAIENEVEITEEDIEENREWIKTSLRSNVLSRKLGDQEGYKVSLAMDSQLQEALSLFDTFETLEDMFVHTERLREQEQ